VSAFEKQLAQGSPPRRRDGARTPIAERGEGQRLDEYALFIPPRSRHGYKNPFPVRPDGSRRGAADGALEIAGELMDRIANAAAVNGRCA